MLLKSNGCFPLSEPCRLALYGNGARHTIKGGTGSGEVNSRYFVTVEDGLEAAGFSITSGAWLDRYDELYPAARKEFIRGLKKQAREHHTLAVIESMGAVMPEPEYDIPLACEGDVAVYVLSRISGEGSDRRPVPGDILLTETEKRDILRLNREYEKFLLVLNVGGVVDLLPVMEVGNILLLSQLGVETGDILADLILGRSVPSGKLTTTWSAWKDYPTIGAFGEKDDTRYINGIYVGYRYFDTADVQPLFPFGFGLGYTGFSITEGVVSEEAGKITVRTTVKNTGTFKGKEVAQLYVSCPTGFFDKPYQSLAAFAKTDELAPGKEQELALTFDLRDLASYDEEHANWILESGDYILRLGSSSRDTKPVAVVRLDEKAVTRRVRNCLGDPGFTDWCKKSAHEEILPELPVLTVRASAFKTEETDYMKTEEIDPLIKTLSDEELCYLNIGIFNPNAGAISAIGDASQTVAGAAGETTGVLREKGIPSLVMSDGPAGLRLSRQYTRDEKGAHALEDAVPESVMELMPAPVAMAMKIFAGKKKTKDNVRVFEQYCTAIPIGTALAQSFDPSVAESCGDIVGSEMEHFGIHLWLAPALNIHRDIRCGRNFEYFSEDPLISGKIAAAVTRGVQRHPGCGTTIKHFAANNQETNRYNNNSLVSERAMREIYLRGFEITIRESQPHALMTSYNLLNGRHTSERRDLIEDILRSEFGFRGIVMTDWIIPVMTGKDSKYKAPDAALVAAAGNDLMMPGGKGDFEAMMAGLREGKVTRHQLRVNATRIYRMIKKLVLNQ